MGVGLTKIQRIGSMVKRHNPGFLEPVSSAWGASTVQMMGFSASPENRGDKFGYLLYFDNSNRTT
jgi:hypothetical protein